MPIDEILSVKNARASMVSYFKKIKILKIKNPGSRLDLAAK